VVRHRHFGINSEHSLERFGLSMNDTSSSGMRTSEQMSISHKRRERVHRSRTSGRSGEEELCINITLLYKVEDSNFHSRICALWEGLYVSVLIEEQVTQLFAPYTGVLYRCRLRHHSIGRLVTAAKTQSSDRAGLKRHRRQKVRGLQ
jgi:hypothetical protein